MHPALLAALADIRLTSKSAAALIGVADQSLRQARCNTPRSARHDTYFPEPERVPPRNGSRPHVRYRLVDIVDWAEKQRRRSLYWDALPLSVRLPVERRLATAGGPTVDELRAALTKTQ